MESKIAPVEADLDYDLEAEVRDAIMSLDSVRATHAEVDVAVKQGHVTLSGIVQSPMAAIEVERTAAEVPGVAAVTNHLLDDGTLARNIAEALARDERTRSIPPGYRVSSTFGHVRIAGYFEDEAAQAVLAVAQAVPGVREVSIRALR
jgi:osmotically-inducible protein OsmY